MRIPKPHSMLEEIAEAVAETGFEYEMRSEGLLVDDGVDGTLVSSEAVSEETDDGGKVEQIIRVVSEIDPNERFYPRELLKLNSLCALGAVIPAKESKALKIVSRFTVYEDFEDARTLYVHMTAFAALFNVISFFAGGIVSRISGSESVWAGKEFKAAADILSGAGLDAFYSPTGMSLGIPLKPEIMPDAPMPRNSLLQFDTGEVHPNLGAGLFYKLELPMNISEARQIEYSRILNEKEFSTLDAPPMIGAWTGVPGRNSLTHIGFWPNNMYWPGIVANISIWMVHRNEIACSTVESLLRGQVGE